MAKVDQKKTYGRFSRLRWSSFIFDERDRNVKLGMKDWSFVSKLKLNAEYKSWKIPPEYANRPDLISNLFYGTPDLWWVISSYNDFFHPLKDFYVDRLIKVPNNADVMALLV